MKYTKEIEDVLSKFYPTEQKILRALGDGKPHLKRDLHRDTINCSVGAFSVRLTRLRVKLRRIAPELQILVVPDNDEVILQLHVVKPISLEEAWG